MIRLDADIRMPQDRDFRNELRHQIPIADVIRESVVLQQHASNNRGACPLHPDGSRGLYVMRTGRFHCFSCGAGGDVVDWTMLVEGVDEATAIEHLVARKPPAADGQSVTDS